MHARTHTHNNKQQTNKQKLPLSLLKAATGHPLLVELKNGETYNGRLVSADTYMNMNLQHVICTSSDGEKFWKLPTCYVRGSAIKYLRLPPSLMDEATAIEAREIMSSGVASSSSAAAAASGGTSSSNNHRNNDSRGGRASGRGNRNSGRGVGRGSSGGMGSGSGSGGRTYHRGDGRDSNARRGGGGGGSGRWNERGSGGGGGRGTRG
jgi:U6 snRNA-associated Sm-like protein LSm4